MHPMVKPALRQGWRDLNTVQFGMTPAHAITLGPVDPATGSFLRLLNGTRGLPLLREEGRRMDLPDEHVDALLRRLGRAGLLDDLRKGPPDAQALRERGDALDRLRPDLASLSLSTSEPGAALGLLAARRALRVRVHGAGRVGTVLAALLSGAGVGEVDVRDVGRVEPWDVAPGGLPAESVGERRDEAARAAVRRAAPDRPPRRARASPHAGSGPVEAGLSLVIVAPRDEVAVHAPDPFTTERLMTSGTPHLYAGVVEGTGVVGPLVLPGETSCAGCLHEERTDGDPAYPRLVTQWRCATARRVGACDLTLAVAVAGLAAAHALTFLDGGSPSSAGTRWEASLPALTWHSRSIAPHPACVCGALEKGKGKGKGAAKGEHSSTSGVPRATMAVQRPSAGRRRESGAAGPTGTWRAHV
ncbi:TOMM precursor leader peptide-binding protein [Streptomyces sp. DSM 110735]|uniref:TOMM precursor leader peptide-binding protein n=1 Tax=Streptomyces sp. DSM 110735 TaxID=2775031 RepID=UPI0018F3B1E0|nr:TOMM precursor leader peptide-binding protein [Streptomyces sp. DSM 110735]MBJ7904357.1 TOMM precursor leader peptide-binding protein [Streptomyces sp. DSM 110735]